MASQRKKWFKMPDSVADEPWSNDVLATLTRLQARMNTRWARNGLEGEEIAEIYLSAGDAMSLTRRASFARASQLLRECENAVSLEIHFERAGVKLKWPKWPEFQGLLSRPQGNGGTSAARQVSPPHTQDARRKTQDAEERRATPSVSAAGAASATLAVVPDSPPDPTPGDPPWAMLRNLRPKGDIAPSEDAWERFLADEWLVMSAWQGEDPERRKWPSTAMRFWRQYRSGGVRPGDPPRIGTPEFKAEVDRLVAAGDARDRALGVIK